MRIVQFLSNSGKVKVAKVDGEKLIPSNKECSTYEFVNIALDQNKKLNAIIEESLSNKLLDYEQLINNNQILSPITHVDPSRFIITGTGLTHLGSADARDEMHKADSTDESTKTDTMKMFELGLKGGKPESGKMGIQPEWFYKGDGTTVRAPGKPLYSPSFAMLDGDEVEVCAIHIIDSKGTPFRVGYALGNEFADHTTEKINYLYLAHSKLRECSFGPELLIGELPQEVVGYSRIIRNGKIIWEKEFLSGEKYMAHSLSNLELHHFKYSLFRQPGFLHAHFLGTATVSFAENIKPQHGDIFEMESEVFGKPLRNTMVKSAPEIFEIKNLF